MAGLLASFLPGLISGGVKAIGDIAQGKNVGKSILGGLGQAVGLPTVQTQGPSTNVTDMLPKHEEIEVLDKLPKEQVKVNTINGTKTMSMPKKDEIEKLMKEKKDPEHLTEDNTELYAREENLDQILEEMDGVDIDGLNKVIESIEKKNLPEIEELKEIITEKEYYIADARKKRRRKLKKR